MKASVYNNISTMEPQISGVTDVTLTEDEVVKLVSEAYAPCEIMGREGVGGCVNTIYLGLLNDTTGERHRVTVGLNGKFRGDDRYVTGLPEDFRSQTTFSLGDFGDANNFLRKVLGGIGGYLCDKDNNAHHVSQTIFILNPAIDDEAGLIGQANAWAGDIIADLGVPDSIREDVTGRLVEIFVETKTAKDLEVEKQARRKTVQSLGL